MAETVTKVKVYSNRMDMEYEIHRFSEYKIDIDLETDADGFNMVFENPNGMYTGFFNKFDPISVYINGVPVLYGTIDYTRYVWSESQSHIQIVGRDFTAIFVDNDALPSTFNNVKPSKYIADKCSEYGVTKIVLDESVPIQENLIIGVNESEISIMSNLIVEDHKRIWSIYDTLYMGTWSTQIEPEYYFTRGVPSNIAGIPIKSLDLTDDGTDMKSEVRIYGTMNDGAEKVVGVAKNEYLIDKKIRRRRTSRSSNDDSTSKFASSALKKLREDFRSGIKLEITIKTSDIIVMPNRTAHVIDSITKTNSIFFISSVSYSKEASSGSTTNITMIPGDTTVDVLWQNQSSKTKGNITGSSGLSLTELLKNKK